MYSVCKSVSLWFIFIWTWTWMTVKTNRRLNLNLMIPQEIRTLLSVCVCVCVCWRLVFYETWTNGMSFKLQIESYSLRLIINNGICKKSIGILPRPLFNKITIKNRNFSSMQCRFASQQESAFTLVSPQ